MNPMKETARCLYYPVDEKAVALLQGPPPQPGDENAQQLEQWLRSKFSEARDTIAHELHERQFAYAELDADGKQSFDIAIMLLAWEDAPVIGVAFGTRSGVFQLTEQHKASGMCWYIEVLRCHLMQ